MDVRALFRIVGEEGPALRRVEEAMEWLLSPKAEGLGQQLLHEAHALHGKPLTIAVSKAASNGYLNALGEHTIHINPHHVEQIALSAADGAAHLMSVERCLGHEMTHAGQARAREGAAELLHLDAKITESVQAHLSPAEKAAQHEPMIKAIEAPDYETARKHLGTYVDTFVLPMRDKVERELRAHPEYLKHIHEFEMPAVDIENRIAALRGEPARTDYACSHHIDPQRKRDMFLNELSSILELDSKPRAVAASPQRADGRSWLSMLGDRSGRTRG